MYEEWRAARAFLTFTNFLPIDVQGCPYHRPYSVLKCVNFQSPWHLLATELLARTLCWICRMELLACTLLDLPYG